MVVYYDSRVYNLQLTVNCLHSHMDLIENKMSLQKVLDGCYISLISVIIISSIHISIVITSAQNTNRAQQVVSNHHMNHGTRACRMPPWPGMAWRGWKQNCLNQRNDILTMYYAKYLPATIIISVLMSV